MRPRTYTALLLINAGMGGILVGYDIGIIGAALRYAKESLGMSAREESLIVAAVLGGSTLSTIAAGALADVFGRRRLMYSAAVLFIGSIAVITGAEGFPMLFAGRVLQGFSVGMIMVGVPLHLAECLPTRIRGSGTSIFQLLLTVGILSAAGVGAWLTGDMERLATDVSALADAGDRTWRAMFLTAIAPAVMFLAGSLVVSESPRWLLRHGRPDAALASLARSRAHVDADFEFREMLAATRIAPKQDGPARMDRLLQRKYMLPFLLTCTILVLVQTTGINTILQFLVVILEQAGLPTTAAAGRSTYVAATNVVFTIAGVLLVDRLGRKWLLQIGTGLCTVALLASAAILHQLNSGRMPPTVESGAMLTGCLMLFIAAFAAGPGVCVWLALTELLPTRIRSLGMGLGLLLNQGVSTAGAALFLPVVRSHGFATIFFFWAACTAGFFVITTFVLPETRNRTLEEIEAGFERRHT